MKKGYSILRIFNLFRESLPHGNQFPFAIQKVTWGKDYYVIVEVLNQETGIAYGVPTRNGVFCRLYANDRNWRHELAVPNSREPLWQWREDVDLSYYKNSGGMGRAYELHHRLKWGKYIGFSIEELCQEHMDYIEWAVESIGHNFCLSEKAITSLLESGLVLDAKIVTLNREKLIWYQNDMSDEFLPKFYEKGH